MTPSWFRVLTIKEGTIPTVTGRRIPPPPVMRTDTRRKAQNDIRKAARWIVEQAREEAAARGDGWNGERFQRLDSSRLSPADWDAANDYLFGVEYVFCFVTHGGVGR